MKMYEDLHDDPQDVEFYGSAIKYYRPAEPFEVDGIWYDPTTYESRGNVWRCMIDLIADRGH